MILDDSPMEMIDELNVNANGYELTLIDDGNQKEMIMMSNDDDDVMKWIQTINESDDILNNESLTNIIDKCDDYCICPILYFSPSTNVSSLNNYFNSYIVSVNKTIIIPIIQNSNAFLILVVDKFMYNRNGMMKSTSNCIVSISSSSRTVSSCFMKKLRNHLNTTDPKGNWINSKLYEVIDANPFSLKPQYHIQFVAMAISFQKGTLNKKEIKDVLVRKETILEFIRRVKPIISSKLVK